MYFQRAEMKYNPHTQFGIHKCERKTCVFFFVYLILRVVLCTWRMLDYYYLCASARTPECVPSEYYSIYIYNVATAMGKVVSFSSFCVPRYNIISFFSFVLYFPFLLLLLSLCYFSGFFFSYYLFCSIYSLNETTAEATNFHSFCDDGFGYIR